MREWIGRQASVRGATSSHCTTKVVGQPLGLVGGYVGRGWTGLELGWLGRSVGGVQRILTPQQLRTRGSRIARSRSRDCRMASKRAWIKSRFDVNASERSASHDTTDHPSLPTREQGLTRVKERGDAGRRCSGTSLTRFVMGSKPAAWRVLDEQQGSGRGVALRYRICSVIKASRPGPKETALRPGTYAPRSSGMN